MTDFDAIKHKVERARARLDLANSKIKCYERSIKTVEKDTADLEQAQNIAQIVSQTVQQKAHKRIEGVVGKCLEAIFEGKYGFKIDFVRKRGRTEANLLLLKDGHEVGDALDCDSGGVVDVAALALRLACIVLTKPYLRRTLILDEPFRNLDTQNRENIRMLLEELAEDFKVQFIIVTHEMVFQTGNIIKI